MSSIISVLNRPLISSLRKSLIEEDETSSPAERIANGQFADGSVWVAPDGGWTISGGKATNTSGAFKKLTQLFSTGAIAAGVPFDVSIEITDNPSGDVWYLRWLAADGVTPQGVIINGDVVAMYGTSGTVPANAYGVVFTDDDGGTGIGIDNVSLIA